MLHWPWTNRHTVLIFVPFYRIYAVVLCHLMPNSLDPTSFEVSSDTCSEKRVHLMTALHVLIWLNGSKQNGRQKENRPENERVCVMKMWVHFLWRLCVRPDSRHTSSHFSVVSYMGGVNAKTEQRFLHTQTFKSRICPTIGSTELRSVNPARRFSPNWSFYRHWV